MSNMIIPSQQQENIELTFFDDAEMFDNLRQFITSSSNIIRNTENEVEHEITNTKYLPTIESLPHLDQLELGKYYSYKELITLLEQPSKTSDSKKRQLIEFARFFDFQKVGRKYLINHIYKEAIPYLPVSQTIPSNATYQAETINIIISYLYNSPTTEEIHYLSYLDFAIILGLANHLYKKYYKDHNYIEKETLCTSDDINIFYNRSYAKMKSIILSTLTSMQNRRIIDFTPTYVICFKESNYPIPTFSHREASEKEKLSIITMEHNALQEAGLTSMNELWYCSSKIYTKYKETLQQFLSSNYPYWMHYYKTIKVYSPATVLHTQSSATSAREILNTKMFKFLNNQAVRESSKYITPENINTDSYIKAQQTLNEWLIKLF